MKQTICYCDMCNTATNEEELSKISLSVKSKKYESFESMQYDICPKCLNEIGFRSTKLTFKMKVKRFLDEFEQLDAYFKK